MNSAYALTFELEEVLSNPILDDLQTFVTYYCCPQHRKYHHSRTIFVSETRYHRFGFDTT